MKAKGQNSDPITATELHKYLDETSDFAFEIEVLRELESIGCFDLSHGGTYSDPLTGKSRQYDIRATAEASTRMNILMAVECKRLRPENPLMILCLPPTEGENYHELIKPILFTPDSRLLQGGRERWGRGDGRTRVRQVLV